MVGSYLVLVTLYHGLQSVLSETIRIGNTNNCGCNTILFYYYFGHKFERHLLAKENYMSPWENPHKIERTQEIMPILGIMDKLLRVIIRPLILALGCTLERVKYYNP